MYMGQGYFIHKNAHKPIATAKNLLRTANTGKLSLVHEVLNYFSKKFKGPYGDHILIPRVRQEVVLFLVSNESPNFSHYNQIRYTL